MIYLFTFITFQADAKDKKHPDLEQENTKDTKAKTIKKAGKDIEKEQLTNNDTDKRHLPVNNAINKNMTESDTDINDMTESDTDVNDMSESDADKKHMTDNETSKKHVTVKHMEKKITADEDKNDKSRNDTDRKHITENETAKKHIYGDHKTSREKTSLLDNTSAIDAISIQIDNTPECISDKKIIDQKYSDSEIGRETSSLPTLSETVLNMFIEDDNQMSQNYDIINEIEDFRIIPGSLFMPNKPTAIIKPCQKTDVEDIIIDQEITKERDSTEKSTMNLKMYDSKQLSLNQQTNESTEFKSEEETKDYYDEITSSSKEEDERKEKTRSTTVSRTEEDITDIASKLKGVEKETKAASEEIEQVEENNRQMMIIVDKFEKTISQLVMEKEREEVCHQIVMER